MTNSFYFTKQKTQPVTALRWGQISSTVVFMALSLWANPSLASDPFRSSNPKPIGEKTGAAFRAIFQDGNYRSAENLLQQAEAEEPNEPLALALQASLAYLKQDNNKLNSYASKTLATAQRLKNTDPLRGNIYTAVGYSLEAGYIMSRDGTVKGTPQAMTKLQQVFEYFDAASAISAKDPELNLFKGYLDLMLGLYLPFSNPSQGLKQLEQYAGPRYLANRGMALGYREMKQFDKALDFANQALAETPNNPEIQYLQAQLLVRKGNKTEASKGFQSALSKSGQLPKDLVAQIFLEQCRNEREIDGKNRDCPALRNQIKNTPGDWGPRILPKL